MTSDISTWPDHIKRRYEKYQATGLKDLSDEDLAYLRTVAALIPVRDSIRIITAYEVVLIRLGQSVIPTAPLTPTKASKSKKALVAEEETFEDDYGSIHDDSEDEEELVDKVFEPEECLFAIFDAYVCFTPIAYWKKHKCMADFIGGENFPEGLLDSCGVSSVEMTESTFSFPGSASKVHKALVAAGFHFSKAFEKFLS